MGHVVTTHALGAGEPAPPYDEVAQLDMVQADKANGDDDAAESRLREKVIDRRDDELPPIELPHRTAQIVDRQGWRTDGAHPRRTG